MDFIIKKAKGCYLYSGNNEKYFDFTDNANIAGYSNKNIIHKIKNNISSSFNITGNTIYHKRIIKLFNNLFSDNYLITACFSIEEFFLKLINYIDNKNYSLKITSDNQLKWFNENINDKYLNIENNNIINLTDAAEFLLNNIDLTQLLKNLNSKELFILNYYYYPELPVSIYDADIVILPRFLSAGFEFVLVLIKKKSILFPDYKSLCYDIVRMPSLYLSSCINQYYLIKRIDKDNIASIKSDDIIQSDRLFVFKNIERLSALKEYFFEKKILLNYKPLYYNYLPLILDDNQKKYINRIFEC